MLVKGKSGSVGRSSLGKISKRNHAGQPSRAHPFGEEIPSSHGFAAGGSVDLHRRAFAVFGAPVFGLLLAEHGFAEGVNLGIDRFEGFH